MKKIKTILSYLWIILTGLISPLWIGGTYMIITGHGKGYAYEMGSEAVISFFFGFVVLMLWLIAVIPIMIWLCRKCFKAKRVFTFIPVAVFILFFGLGVFLMGLDDFLRQFGVLY